MKNYLLIFLMLCLGIYSSHAQKQQQSDYYNLKKAIEILDNDGNEEEAMKYLDLQLKETPQDSDVSMLKAAIYKNQGKYGMALSEINKALRFYHKKGAFPKYAIYRLRAGIYETMKEPQKALGDYDMAYKLVLKEAPDQIHDILYQRAQVYFDLKNYDAADTDYRLMLKHNEADQVAMIGLVRNMIERGEYDKALILVNECEKYDADYDEVYRFRMQIYDKTDEVDKAIDDAIAYFDKSDNPSLELTNPIFKKHLSYALAQVNAKIAYENDNYGWKMLRTTIYELGHDYIGAIKAYDDIEKEFGISPQILYYRANCYNEIGNMERAVADMTRSIELVEKDKNYLPFLIGRRADYYRIGGDYKNAIIDYTTYMELDPMSAYPYYGRGWSYELSGDEESAMKDYNAGIDVDKSYPYIFLQRGELYLKRGEKEKANADFNEVISQDTVVRSGSCRQYALHFLGREAEALEWMDKIIAVDSIESGGLYDKACLLARMGRLDESVAALRKAFENGYRSFAHIEHDDDMDAIRKLPEFKRLIEEYKAKPIRIEADDEQAKDKIETVSEIQMKKMHSGLYEIPCTINELPLKFCFDTGASTVTISSVEANFMLKNGYLKSDDIKGKEYYSVATGEIHEGTTIRLREIKIGDAILRNVDASVVHNQQAPLLLGQTVLERFGTVTIDNINSKLIIKQK
ncbi:MAG: retroviral-like aspartic protease family protein [Alistipes sp.]|nr:retroviral-like aspartic protease family protein [Alistipes sp.]